MVVTPINNVLDLYGLAKIMTLKDLKTLRRTGNVLVVLVIYWQYKGFWIKSYFDVRMIKSELSIQVQTINS